MKKENQLSRAEMKSIRGGVPAPPSNCSASCGNSPSVSCSGTACNATDGVGYSSIDGNGAPEQHDCAG
jgi:hypothetical protein